MAFIELMEIVDLIVVTLALGYIFSAYIRKPKTELELVYPRFGLTWDEFKFAMMVTAPAVILHELAHKFVAIALGLTATF